MKIICFHNPEEENGYLSNWYLSDFTVCDRKFSSAEQYMMYQKAVCFDDTAIAEKIMNTSDVAIIKSLGRDVSGYDDKVRDAIRKRVVYKGVFAKFPHNNDLKRQLLDTEDCIPAECAVKDLVWGIRLSMKDSQRFDMTKMERKESTWQYSYESKRRIEKRVKKNHPALFIQGVLYGNGITN